MDNLRDYQSAETAWRYDVRLCEIRKKIAVAEQALEEHHTQLDYLLANPPMFRLFNWSA